MAKKTSNAVEEAELVETPNLPSTEDLYAGLSDEERAELLALTGQTSNLRGEKVPIIKTNYSDLDDRDGNSIKKGNFVYGQNSKTVEDGDEIKNEYIGVDLGKTPEVTILAYRQQYAYYNDDPKQRCNSQIFGEGETPVGSTLGFECRSGKCPRRATGLDRKEKCTCQYVVMAKVDIEGEAKPAMMYVKGKSFITFSEYLKSLGKVPVLFAPTKLSNKMEKQGSVTYFVTNFELQNNKIYSKAERDENVQLAKAAVGSLEEFKKSQTQKKAASQIVDKSAGSNATPVEDFDDDIQFD